MKTKILEVSFSLKNIFFFAMCLKYLFWNQLQFLFWAGDNEFKRPSMLPEVRGEEGGEEGKCNLLSLVNNDPPENSKGSLNGLALSSLPPLKTLHHFLFAKLIDSK